MKRNKSLLFILFLIFISFSALADTVDTYKIYIGKKLLVTEDSLNTPSRRIVLDSTNYNDALTIYYNRDAGAASERRIKLIDQTGTVIITWHFSKEEMVIPIKSFWNNGNIQPGISYHLQYFDDRLPAEGILLTEVIAGKKPLTHIKASATQSRIYWTIGVAIFIIILLLYYQRAKVKN